MSEPTIFAVVTPPGRGAVATVAVRGLRAIEIVGRRFEAAAGRPLANFPPGRVVIGSFRDPRGAAEELVVGLIGPGEVEIHCHGGLAAVEAVAAALAAEGAQRLTPEAWAWPAAGDALTAEAALALTAATTERTAGILLDQLRGALGRELVDIAADLIRGELVAAHRRLVALARHGDLGLHLTAPWKVVIAGRPNVGKSSLANALLGYQRSIVFDQPGTTRDVLTATTALSGWPIELVDTAGLRAGSDAIEAEGVRRAERELAAADAVLFITDCTLPWSSQNTRHLSHARRVIVVHNKCDLAPPPRDGRPEGIATSAATSQGLEELSRVLAAALVPETPEPGAPVPFSSRQIALLQQALTAVECRDVIAARQAIEETLTPSAAPGYLAPAPLENPTAGRVTGR
jgi:tRNA modification GTPase